MKEVEGDLLDMFENGQFDVIVHGCNCFNNMNAGIAGKIIRRWPVVADYDNLTVRGDPAKLGTIGFVPIGNSQWIINAYTQFGYGTHRRQVEYGAVRSCMTKIFQAYEGDEKFRIGFPLIGCGLAGGDWDVVSRIIEDELLGCDYTIVTFNR